MTVVIRQVRLRAAALTTNGCDLADNALLSSLMCNPLASSALAANDRRAGPGHELATLLARARLSKTGERARRGYGSIPEVEYSASIWVRPESHRDCRAPGGGTSAARLSWPDLKSWSIFSCLARDHLPRPHGRDRRGYADSPVSAADEVLRFNRLCPSSGSLRWVGAGLLHSFSAILPAV